MTNTETKSGQLHHKFGWIWLGYTGFLFLPPLLQPSLILWLATLAVFCIFLLIFWGYFNIADKSGSTQIWMILATFVLGLIAFPWNQGASTFFVYAAAFLPFSIESVRSVLYFFLLESLLILGEGCVFTVSANHGPFYIGWPNTFVTIFLVLIIGGGNIFFAEQRRADCKLRAAQQENIALAAVAERERIARDLHDVLGHTLSVIVLKAELAGRLIPIDPARAIAEIADVERTSRTALAEVREAIGGYRARGLAAEIEAAHATLQAAGVKLIAESNSAQTAALTPQEETALSLVLREAVTNIVRHAHATSCSLQFVSEAGRRRLVVEDDGEHVMAREGNGIRGMRERVESIGGHFILERGIALDRGTRLTLELPQRKATTS
jgi:two-component system sensor histidine kinase DesK